MHNRPTGEDAARLATSPTNEPLDFDAPTEVRAQRPKPPKLNRAKRRALAKAMITRSRIKRLRGRK